MDKKKVTRKELDAVYARPIDPKNPFERLSMLMTYGIQELTEIKIKPGAEVAPKNELHTGAVGSHNFFEPDESELNESR
jgi:hypothetical protein